jgi:hypothetical protein
MRNCLNYLEISNTAPTLVVGTSATLTIVPTALENKDRYALRYCVRWNGAQGNEALLLSVNGTVYPVLDLAGNPVVVSQVRRREKLIFAFSNITSTTPAVTPHFTVLGCLAHKCVQTPVTTAAAAV